MGPQQQHQPAQHLRPVVEPATIMASPVAAAAAAAEHGKHCSSSRYSLDDQAQLLQQHQHQHHRNRLFLNPWKELAPEDFVIGYARGLGRVRCSSCACKISAGQLQLGAFYMHEDRFTLLRWHHQSCVDAPECLTSPMDLCGIEDLSPEDVDEVCRWLGHGSGSVKDRTWTA